MADLVRRITRHLTCSRTQRFEGKRRIRDKRGAYFAFS
jgi:hypothetical protein